MNAMFEIHNDAKVYVPRTDGEHYHCTLCTDYHIKITDPFQNIRKHYLRKHHKKFVHKHSLISLDDKNESKIIYADEYNTIRRNDRILNNITNVLSTMYWNRLIERNLITILHNFTKLVDVCIIRYEENKKN